MAMSDFLRRFVGTANGPQDRVFQGFVAFAVIVGGYTGLRHARLDGALRRASTCLAQEDAAGAGRAVEDARAIDADNPRVRLAALDLNLLLGEVDAAQGGLAAFTTGDMSGKLTAAAHGDVLLLQGDLAAAAGDLETAKKHYAGARLLVDREEVVVARLERLGRREQRTAEERAALFADFNRLLEAAEARNVEVVPLRARDLSQRIMKVSNLDARTKLFLAVSAAERAARAGSQVGMFSIPSGALVSPRLTAPVRDESPARTALAERVYQRKLAEYQQAVAAGDERRDSVESARRERAAAASRIAAQNLDEARALIAEARDLLGKEGSAPR